MSVSKSWPTRDSIRQLEEGWNATDVKRKWFAKRVAIPLALLGVVLVAVFVPMTVMHLGPFASGTINAEDRGIPDQS